MGLPAKTSLPSSALISTTVPSRGRVRRAWLSWLLDGGHHLSLTHRVAHFHVDVHQFDLAFERREDRRALLGGWRWGYRDDRAGVGSGWRREWCSPDRFPSEVRW